MAVEVSRRSHGRPTPSRGARVEQRKAERPAAEQPGGQMVVPTHLKPHRYLSTACFHGEHDYCKADTGQAGAKRAAQCKFCAAPCRCNCHEEASGG